MQFSENTLTILRNYATINDGLYFKEGNVLRTINAGGKTLMAEAIIDEHIPSNFGIHELSKLLSIISLHKNSPELTLKGNDLLIQSQDGRSKITYRTCAADMIKSAPDKKLDLPTEDISFLLTEADFNWIMKSTAVLGSPNISVSGHSGKLFVGGFDSVDDSAHTDNLEVDSYNGPDARFVFKTENWKMIPGTYKVTISSKGVGRFENTARKLTYWVALEAQRS